MLKTIYQLFNLVSALGCIFIGIILTLEIGFQLSDANKTLFIWVHNGIYGFYLLDIAYRTLYRKKLSHLKKHPLDVFVLALLLLQQHSSLPVFSSYLSSQFGLFALMFSRISHLGRLLNWLKFKPTQTLALGFLFAIFTGSLLLSLPISTVAPDGIPFIDSIFTATSAVCVTGLLTLDVGETFTRFGQIVILGLIQIGGLGIMSFAALLSIYLGGRMHANQTKQLFSSYTTESMKQTGHMLRSIITITLTCEVIGTLFLAWHWRQQFKSIWDTLYMAVFHAVSGFCNAGIALFPNSFTAFASHTPTLLIMSVLILCGGLGFPVIFDILTIKNKKKSGRFRLLKLQSKLALIVTAILIVSGTCLILFTEYHHSLAAYSFWDKTMLSLFHSISARTAGFHALDVSQFLPTTLLVLMLMMFIGASPGSTGSGIKTTTFGLVMVGVWQTMKGKNKVEIGKRTIRQSDILKALAILVISTWIIIGSLFVLLQVNNQGFTQSLFESLSAFGNVGFSLGMTSSLTFLGKGCIMVVMFLGRVGPLTIAFALSTKDKKSRHEYPEEKILMI